MKYILMKMDTENKEFTEALFFGAWRDHIMDKKLNGGNAELSRQVEMYREMHRTDVRKLMYKLVSADDTTSKHVCLMTWSEYTKAERNLRHHEAAVSSIHSKNNHVLDKAVLKWGAE